MKTVWNCNRLKLNGSGGALHNLDLDMGVGQLNLTSTLTGESDFDLGVGESNITIIGNRDDYKLDRALLALCPVFFSRLQIRCFQGGQKI